MHRLLVLVMVCLLCVSCAEEEKEIAPAIEFRTQLIESEGCRFVAEVVADFGKTVEKFSLACDYDGENSLSFTVLQPDTLAGITATVTDSGGQITYDGLAMDFGLMANGNVIPACAPAIVASCWTGEYISAAGTEDDLYRVTYEKNFDKNRIIVDTWYKKGIPISAEICYNNQRVIKMTISDFSFH